MSNNTPLIEVKNLKVHFPVRKGLFRNTTSYIKAVDGITFSINKGETLGLVGESGCGKTTTARAILQLIKPTSGDVLFDYYDETLEQSRIINLPKVSETVMKKVRKQAQLIFQDPYSSLDPRMKIKSIIVEPLLIHDRLNQAEIDAHLKVLLKHVGLNSDVLERYPHEFSGGQRQRIVIARALALNPNFIVADEPVSALDVSIKAQIINLLNELQNKFHLTLLFISHDLSVVRHVCENIVVMYLGKIVEMGKTEDIIFSPKHPYTEALLLSVPIPDPKIEKNKSLPINDIPNVVDIPEGCSFQDRCQYAQDICKNEDPPSADTGNGHVSFCHFANSIELKSIAS
jgi:oligopeptide/dipeptide ABC transporter ATP-binding protein